VGSTEVPRLSSRDLIARGRRAPTAMHCGVFSALACPGWESMPGGFDIQNLRRVGTLRDESEDEPTLDENLPKGVHGWAATAPIDLRWAPYNRCEVWACVACARPFLRFTEYGGYYVDERIRQLNPELVVSL
jgi:hypothetical protein